jgi:hypothetical protein
MHYDHEKDMMKLVCKNKTLQKKIIKVKIHLLRIQLFLLQKSVDTVCLLLRKLTKETLY